MTKITEYFDDFLPLPTLLNSADEAFDDNSMLLPFETGNVDDVQSVATSRYSREGCDERAKSLFGEQVGSLQEPTYFNTTESVVELTQQFFAFCLNKQGFYEAMRDNLEKAEKARVDARTAYKQKVKETAPHQQNNEKITITQKKPEVKPPKRLSEAEAAQEREERLMAKMTRVANALAKKAKANSVQEPAKSTEKTSLFRPDTSIMFVLISFIKEDKSEQKVCFVALSGHNYILPNQPGESFQILTHEYNFKNCQLFDEAVKEFQTLPRSESIKFFFLGKNSDTADAYFRGIYKKINNVEDDKVQKLFDRNCAETKISHFFAKFSAAFGDHYKMLGSIVVSFFPSDNPKHDESENYIKVSDSYFLKKPACEYCMEKKESIMLGINSMAEHAVLHGANEVTQ